MATVTVKSLYKVTARGRDYYYAWRGGPRIMAEFGTKEFWTEVADLRNPLANGDRRKFGTWVKLYKASHEYAGLSQDSKKDIAPKLDSIIDEFGSLSLSAFERPQIKGPIKTWRDQWRETPRTADKAKSYLSQVFSFIISEGHLTTNPCAGIDNIYTNNRADIIWTPGDLSILYATEDVSDELKEAAEFAALTSYRQGALLEVPWTRIEKNCINMIGHKSMGASARAKGRGMVPMYPALRAFIERMENKGKRALTVLTNESGEPWKAIGASWNKAMIRSGLKAKGLHFNDLRGTAATNFYRAGLGYQEIADIMGWKSDDVERLINIYVKRDELLLDQIRRMDKVGASLARGEEQV